jgi:Ca-activated chloride channel family protein
MQRLISLLALVSLGLAPLAGSAACHPTTDGPLVSLTSELSQGMLLQNGTHELFVCLGIRGREEVPVERPGLNLALVIDRSGSMASEHKLDYAKSAADQLVERLGPRDRLALITYSSGMRVDVASMPVVSRDVFHNAIAAIRSDGGTNLFGGMRAGYDEVLRARGGDRLDRVILLSDGLVNEGLTDPLAIAAQAASFGERGVHVSTLGLGLSYDDILMRNIAQHSGGNYQYIAQPEEMATFLGRELDELARVVARDPVVRLRLGRGVRVAEVYGYAFHQDAEGVTIPISDIFSGEERKVVLRLEVPASPKKRQPITRASLRFTVAASGQPTSAQSPPLFVRYTPDAMQALASRNLTVLTKVEIVRNAEVMLRAMELQRTGELDAAIGMLDTRVAASRRLNESEFRSGELDRMLFRMEGIATGIEATRHDAARGRDLQLLSDLSALGYTE